MNWVSIISLVFTGCGLVISIIALIQSHNANEEAKKANKAVLKQNAQAEINRINSEIYQIEREIERLEKPISGVYGIYHDASHTNQISKLKARKRNLEEQRKQLQQL